MKPWVIFLAVSWTFVLGLVTWSFKRLLSDQGKKHFDPDGVGPAKPAAKGRVEEGKQE